MIVCEALDTQRFSEEDPIEWDMRGPQKAPLRMWVHLHDYRDKRNAVGLKKATELEGQVIKKPKDMDVAKMNKALTVNHGIDQHGFNLQVFGSRHDQERGWRPSV